MATTILFWNAEVLRVTGIIMLASLLFVWLALQTGVNLHTERLAFTSNRTGNSDIFLADVPRGLLVNLTHSHADELNPMWSPDGKRIAYVTSMQVGGSTPVYILDTVQKQHRSLDQESTSGNSLIWSPDSTQLVLQLAQEPGVAILDVDQPQPVKLTNHAAVLGTWSPDGHQLAFVANSGSYADIYLIDVDTGEAKNITLTSWCNDFLPVWSPDGQYLAFISDRSLTPELYMMRLKTGETIYLGKSDNILGWSPDSRRIMFQDASTGNWELYILDVFTRVRQNISNHPEDDLAAAWSPNGEQITFISSRDGNWDVYVLDLETDAVTNISVSAAIDTAPVWWP